MILRWYGSKPRLSAIVINIIESYELTGNVTVQEPLAMEEGKCEPKHSLESLLQSVNGRSFLVRHLLVYLENNGEENDQEDRK